MQPIKSFSLFYFYEKTILSHNCDFDKYAIVFATENKY